MHLTKLSKLLLSLLSLVIIYLLLITPNLNRPQAVSTLSDYAFAHRGLFDMSQSIPENSLLAFQRAIDYGYGIELDVQLTKDKVPVILHDYSLQRPCGINALVSQYTYSELAELSLFGTDYTIPTLEEALTLINGQVPIMIELKVNIHYQEICQRVATVLESYQGSYCMISFSPLALWWFRYHMPEVLRGQLSTSYYSDAIGRPPILQFMLTHLMLNFLSRPDFISYNYQYDTNPSLNLCKNLFNTPIAVWTIRSPEQYAKASSKYKLIVFDGFIPDS